MIQTSITTDRLQLELLHPNDHEFMRVLVNTAGWIEFIGDRNVHTPEDAMAYVDRIINTPNLYYWVARLKAANTPVGVISFLKRDYLEHFDIGFALLPEFKGQGYAYEGAKGVLDMVKVYPEYQTVLATTIPHNVNSISLLTRLGLHFEGEIKPGEETLHVYTSSPQ